MANELKSVTQNPSFAWWPVIIPVYQLYWAYILVPQEMAKAKQKPASSRQRRGCPG